MIQIRASAETKEMLNRAAALRGQKLSEFMLASARREAEDAILDQRAFFASPADHAKFLAMLDTPAPVSPAAKARLQRKAVWED
jgi:uncharacterized protein (DUF1778 family)